MAEIELVIKIPEEKYNMIKNKTYCAIYDVEVYEAISNGILLPKDLYEGMIITSECSELRYINIVLMDISKSLAIIADKMVSAESEDK